MIYSKRHPIAMAREAAKTKKRLTVADIRSIGLPDPWYTPAGLEKSYDTIAQSIASAIDKQVFHDVVALQELRETTDRYIDGLKHVKLPIISRQMESIDYSFKAIIP